MFRIRFFAVFVLGSGFGGLFGSCDRSTKEGDADKFADHVRTTEYQTPEQEKAGFKLPPGFEITLFAAEPDITKPINMEFDDQGRLWVTQSSEYPIAAGPSAGRDRISILEDTDGDGRADMFTHFDDSLNIPIGIMPISDGAIGFSIPYLYGFADVDGDGRSESRKPLLGPFGYNDTHGMINNLTRGFDGWIQACHGFSNVSTIAGADGDSITLVSGNTFRFKRDGSRVEQTTNGRINPFGMAYDERGYLYSVDCHSKPIFQLVQGGDYPQWGRKDPAIGYAPEMMSYELGSTALSGLVYYASTQFPQAYRGSFFTGDVVTCRIDRTTVDYQGSTPIAKKEDPFLTSEDPWFRPVDLKIGPDGSIYIADFYNRIIGHYEVSLDHPGRDRLSGRIWKITYTGDDGGNVPERDWSTASIEELIAGLEHPQLVTRLKIADRMVEVVGKAIAEPLIARLGSLSVTGQVHALWILHRLGALTESATINAMQHDDTLIQLHALRIVSESASLSADQARLVQAALGASDPFLRRTAAEVLGRFPDQAHVKLLMDQYRHCPAEDTHLKYTVLLALRNNLRGPGVADDVVRGVWDADELSVLSVALRDVPSASAPAFVLNYVLTHEVSAEELRKGLEFAGRFAQTRLLEGALPAIRERFSSDLQVQLSLFLDIRDGIAQRGAAVPPKLAGWGIELAHHFLDDLGATEDAWRSYPMQDRSVDRSPWIVSDAFLTNVKPAFRIYLSERNGYVPMAILNSHDFELPERLSMSVFDNDIHNREEKTGASLNEVRIRLLATDQVVASYRATQKATMTFNDLIKEVTLDLKEYAGQRGYVQVVDSTEKGSIGIGNFKPEVVEMPFFTPSDLDERRVKAVQIAGDFRVSELRGRLVHMLNAPWVGVDVRIAAANALANMPAGTDSDHFGAILLDNTAPQSLREHVAANLGQLGGAGPLGYLRQALAIGARPIQLAAAWALAGSTMGVGVLLDVVEAGSAPADLLAEFKVKEAWEARATPAALRTRAMAILGKGGDERQARKKLIEERVAGFVNTGKQVNQGKQLFQANCGTCHRVAGLGGMIGPQLDGIGNWGVQALTEKILDPNRNISESFRTYNIKLKNGKQLSGLYRRNEGEILVFADISGAEFRVAKGDMQDYTPSPYTLMPDQFRHTLSNEQFDALLEYLLSVK